MRESEGGSTGRDDSTLAQEFGEFAGDFTLESPESSTDDQGAPPAVGSDATPAGEDPTALSSEGSPDAEHAGAPPAVAADAAPDADDPTDYLADATPLPYVVNGQERTFDGITYLGPDKGAFIEPGKLDAVRQRLSERDHLHETKLRQSEDYKTLERATTWHTKDAQGNPTTLTGARAVQASRESFARSAAFNREFAKITAGEVDPRDAIGVDANGNVFWRQDWVDGLTARATFEGDKAAFAAARSFEAMSAPPPPAPADPSTLAAPTIAQFEAAYQVQGLTPEDRTFLTQQFARYLTPDRQAVDPAFLDLMKRTAASNTARATAVTQAADITKTNAAKLAAAARGVRPPVAAPRPIAAPSPSTSKDDAWDQMEDIAFKRMQHAS